MSQKLNFQSTLNQILDDSSSTDESILNKENHGKLENKEIEFKSSTLDILKQSNNFINHFDPASTISKDPHQPSMRATPVGIPLLRIEDLAAQDQSPSQASSHSTHLHPVIPSNGGQNSYRSNM